jgi:uncharacterized protein (DUF2236 family)
VGEAGAAFLPFRAVPSSPNPLARLRDVVTNDIRGLLTAEELPSSWFERSAGDQGLFGPGSSTWRVHRSRAGLIGGLRALFLQSLHPLAMAGVAQHSDYRNDPWGRLRRTGSFIAVTTYGTTTAAERAIAAVRRAHEQVTGVAPNGVPYRANDPELLAWVHATEVDSFLRAFQRYGDDRLTAPEADRYVAEMAVVAVKLGVVAPPTDRSELRAYLYGVRPELRAERQAREATRFLLAPPLPAYLRPAYGVLTAAAVGLLPAFARAELRLPAPPLADPLVVRPAARALLGVLGWAMGPPAHGADPGGNARAQRA